jgi:competence protein ComFC
MNMLNLNYQNFEKSFAIFYYLKNTDLTHVSNRILSLKEGVFGNFGDYCTDLIAENLKMKKIDFCVRALSSKRKYILPKSEIGSQKLGLSLSQKLGIGYIPHILKEKTTKPMHSISDKSERFSNINGSYSLNEQIINNLDLNESRILIIDDISTTGATVNEISRVLKDQWPKVKLYFACVAKINNEVGDSANKLLLTKYSFIAV